MKLYTLASTQYVETTPSKLVNFAEAKRIEMQQDKLRLFLHEHKAFGVTGVQIGIPYAFSFHSILNEELLYFNAFYTKAFDSETISSLESCLSYSQSNLTEVKRYNSIIAHYDTLVNNGQETSFVTISTYMNGTESIVFQHEADHQHNITIYKK